MQHFLPGDNIGLVTSRQSIGDWQYIFISKLIGDFNLTGTAGRYGSGNYFPSIPISRNQRTTNHRAKHERTPNLNTEIVKQIAEQLGLTFTNEKETTKNTFAPIDILDYIYAVLHSPTYREKYKEFLKIDFPRVPYPKDKATFWQLVNLADKSDKYIYWKAQPLRNTSRNIQ
jgi:predicted helicase